MTENTTRHADLRQILLDRRREIENDVHARIRVARAGRPTDVGDDLDYSDAGIQGDIERSLIQIRAETLTRIDEALVRLDADKYGSCFDCGRDIPERRLRALPFAVRCQACEEKREERDGRVRRRAQQGDGFSLFPETVSS